MVCDLRTVIQVFQNNIGSSDMQMDTVFMDNLFRDYLKKENIYSFQSTTISKWLKGREPLPKVLIEHYRVRQNALKQDISNIIRTYIFDKNNLYDDMKSLVLCDHTLPDDVKEKLLGINEPLDFLVQIIFTSISRPYRKIGKLFAVDVPNSLSPDISSYFENNVPPDPCKNFCGRTAEIKELHDLLTEHRHIFIQGIGGIGKSEFVKAYAKTYKKDYTNIFFFTYNGSLTEMLADMEDSAELSNERFNMNNKILRTMNEDTLLIIDNFNISETDDEFLPVLLQYKCRILFTTRYIFDCGFTYELKEISNIDTLIELFSKIYPDTEQHLKTVTEIIHTVYCHTFVVCLSASLLANSLLAPKEVLKKLKHSSVSRQFKEVFKSKKNNINKKATYHGHIQMIFDLFALSAEMKNILCSLCFVSTEGINLRLFAKLNELETANDINDLIENGLIHSDSNGKISLHPLICDIVFEDLKPTVSGRKILLNSIRAISMKRDEVNRDYRLLFKISENISRKIIVDDRDYFITFLNDVICYMDDLRYDSGMEHLLNRLSEYESEMNQRDLAVYYNHLSGLSFLRDNLSDTEYYLQKALTVCPPDFDPLAYANTCFSAGSFYKFKGDISSALSYMEQGCQYLNIADNGNEILFDKYNMLLVYAETLSDSPKKEDVDKAIRLLKHGLQDIEKIGTKNSTFYAEYSYYLGCLLYKSGDSSYIKYLKDSLEVHKNIYSYAPEIYSDRIKQLSQLLGMK